MRRHGAGDGAPRIVLPTTPFPPLSDPSSGRRRHPLVAGTRRARGTHLPRRPGGHVELAETGRTDVEADVGHVVEVFARDEPHDVAYLTLAVAARQSRECLGLDSTVACELCRVVQRSALSVRKQRARPVLGYRVITRRVFNGILGGVPPVGVHAELAAVDACNPLAYEHRRLRWQSELLVQPGYLAVEGQERSGHAR